MSATSLKMIVFSGIIPTTLLEAKVCNFTKIDAFHMNFSRP